MLVVNIKPNGDINAIEFYGMDLEYHDIYNKYIEKVRTKTAFNELFKKGKQKHIEVHTGNINDRKFREFIIGFPNVYFIESNNIKVLSFIPRGQTYIYIYGTIKQIDSVHKNVMSENSKENKSFKKTLEKYVFPHQVSRKAFLDTGLFKKVN